MERHRQRHRQVLLRELVHLRHQPAGGEAHIAQADIHAVFLAQQAQESADVVVVVQRFAAAHQHDVVDTVFAVQIPVRRQHFAQHLPRRQRADAPFQRAGAELAPHAAADLRRDAQRIAVVVVHQHTLDAVAILQTKEEFHRIVNLAFPLVNDADRLRHSDFLQLRAHRRRQIRHRVKIRALMNPAENLLAAKSGHSLRLAPVGQLLRRHACQFGHAFFLRIRHI